MIGRPKQRIILLPGSAAEQKVSCRKYPAPRRDAQSSAKPRVSVKPQVVEKNVKLVTNAEKIYIVDSYSVNIFTEK
ncbi:hypothetical protein HOY34_14535 [Xinfangfangia sp. D13-10-4-6]|uniref:hypothetical protein n=1 Tax=Pseudogemmobacter hezensis TaxID=2737662 RepID=UPI001556229D|nr:hypothetical protein [Pseudogemmobacter hezensis]NPD16414.1 hypothetical protein [Pseudogemmobacter hezensis]